MQCKFCRTEIPEGATVCPICGTPVPPQEENPISEQDEITNQDESHYQDEITNQDKTNYQDESYYQNGADDASRGKQPGDSGQMNGGGYSYQQDFERNYNQNAGQYQYHYDSQNNYNQNGYNQNGYNQNGYNQNNYNQNGYGQNGNPVNGTKYMIFAVLTTILCCLPFGIVAVIYASRINSLQRIGDFAGAGEAAKKAKIFSIISAVLALIVMIGYGILFAAFPEEADFTSGVKNTDIIYPEEEDEEKAVGEAEENQVTDDKEPEKNEPTQVSGELGKTWDSFTVQLDDSILKFPCKLQDVKNAGFKMDDSTVTKEYVINPKEYRSVFMRNTQGATVMFDFSNETDEVQKITDCDIIGIYVDEYSVGQSGSSIVFPGGIEIGTSEKDVLKAYGEAIDSFEGEDYDSYSWYVKNDYGKTCQIAITPKTKQVKYMSMRYKNY